MQGFVGQTAAKINMNLFRGHITHVRGATGPSECQNMKNDYPFDVVETVARAFPGKYMAKAEQFLHWLDVNGYTIAEKEVPQEEVSSAPRSRAHQPI
jgi:hypothetical protein